MQFSSSVATQADLILRIEIAIWSWKSVANFTDSTI